MELWLGLGLTSFAPPTILIIDRGVLLAVLGTWHSTWVSLMYDVVAATPETVQLESLKKLVPVIVMVLMRSVAARTGLSEAIVGWTPEFTTSVTVAGVTVP